MCGECKGWITCATRHTHTHTDAHKFSYGRIIFTFIYSNERRKQSNKQQQQQKEVKHIWKLASEAGKRKWNGERRGKRNKPAGEKPAVTKRRKKKVQEKRVDFVLCIISSFLFVALA